MLVKKNFRYLLLITVLIGFMWTEENVIDTKVTCAEPFVKLDYGQKEGLNGQIPDWWRVDKGSLRSKGTVDKPHYIIHATFCNEEFDMDERDYQFETLYGKWFYRWDGWTGKGDRVSSGVWRPVKLDKLANDILYIAINSIKDIS